MMLSRTRRTAVLAVLVHALAGLCAAQCEILNLDPHDGGNDDRFGTAVAMGPDHLLVGSPLDDDLEYDAGSVYVYAHDGTFLRKLLADDGDSFDGYGSALGISGTTAIVGAYPDDQNGYLAGSAYLVDVSTGNQLHKLLPADASENDYFGQSVAIDGNVVVVACPGDRSWTGAAYVFDSVTGQQLHKLVPHDVIPHDHFGDDVDVCGDQIVVGSATHAGKGAAYVFDAITGDEIVKLTAPDGQVGDSFGSAVAIDKGFVLVGAQGDDDLGEKSGSAYVFEIPSGVLLYKLTKPGGKSEERFGGEVAADDGLGIVSAAYTEEAIYSFDLETGGELSEIWAADGPYYAWDLEVARPFVIAGSKYHGLSGNARTFLADSPRGENYCGPANLNSTGKSARISAEGCPVSYVVGLSLHATDMPHHQLGYFLVSDQQGFAPFVGGSQGNLCLGGGIGRFRDQVVVSDAAGTFEILVDPTVLPRPPGPVAVQPGETWHFQAWFRDNDPGPTSNFTDGLSITFL